MMLLDLKKLRALGWDELWKTVAEKGLITYFATHLADQDIFNAVIKEYPGMALSLPRYWNVQLSERTRSELCYSKIPEIKVSVVSSRSLASVNEKLFLFLFWCR